jgi:hypothetical protein
MPELELFGAQLSSLPFGIHTGTEKQEYVFHRIERKNPNPPFMARAREKPGILGKMFRQPENSTKKEKASQLGFSAKSPALQKVCENLFSAS